MRCLFGFICVLALAAMGCSETSGTGGTAGDGGVGGVGGNGGVGGGVVTDCTGEEGDTECVFGETPGHCFNEVCFVSDCSGVEDRTACSKSVYGVGLDYSYACVGGACMDAVGDCADPSDEGSPCWLSEDPPEFGLCEAGVCRLGAAPEIRFVTWQWLDDPCDANASGQSLVVQIHAFVDGRPARSVHQLTYSGQVQDCTGDLNASETTLSCEVYLGARQSEATVTDPQGNEDTMFFAPEPCTNDCEPPGCGVKE